MFGPKCRLDNAIICESAVNSCGETKKTVSG